jgi:hypothetical protein
VLVCPNCGAELTPAQLANEAVRCVACERTFSRAQAKPASNGVRALTQSDSLRQMLNTMTKNPKS